jgi:hypothetical protein
MWTGLSLGRTRGAATGERFITRAAPAGSAESLAYEGAGRATDSPLDRGVRYRRRANRSTSSHALRVQPAVVGGATGPGWTTILRGPAPTGMVAITVLVSMEMTETSFEFSLVT